MEAVHGSVHGNGDQGVRFEQTDRGAICILRARSGWVPMTLEDKLKSRGVRAYVSPDGQVHAAIPFVSDDHASRIRRVLEVVESERN